MFWRSQSHLFVLQGLLIFKYILWPIIETIISVVSEFISQRASPDNPDTQGESAEQTAFRGKWRDYERARETYRDARHQERARPRPKTKREKYLQVLGLTGTPDSVMIRRGYRQLVKKYHPDKYAADAHTDEERKLASIKMRQINEAYDWLEENPAKA